MADGLGKGEKGVKQPEKDFQRKGIQKSPHPQLVMVLLQPLGKETGRNALNNGEAPMDKGGIGGNKEGPMETGDKSCHRTHHRLADEAGQDNAYRPEIDNAPAGPHIPVGAADGKDGKEQDEKHHMPPAEMLGGNGFTEKSGAADQKQEKKENGNAEPYMLDADNPGRIHSIILSMGKVGNFWRVLGKWKF